MSMCVQEGGERKGGVERAGGREGEEICFKKELGWQLGRDRTGVEGGYCSKPAGRKEVARVKRREIQVLLRRQNCQGLLAN